MIKNISNRRINVLVIDDDPDVCKFLEHFLVKHEYEVVSVNDPEHALPMLKKQNFQIILLDIVMPKLDGVEVLKQIRHFDKDVCVIVLSGYPTFDRARDTFKNECYDFLTKPFESERLLSVLDGAVKKYGLKSDLNQLATQQIAETVKQKRAEYKLSLRQLANRTGLSTSLIYQIEHAQTTPSVATLSRLSTALDTPLEDFFKGL
ncbi:MAG: response regulator [candidate division Zixibacteria bacterium]|jgi:DNA-binding NtrC family response regulator|nr:response regulator [candidate division Zixibacteria bacterium]